MRSAYRRVPVPQRQNYRDKTLPAPIMGLVLNENLASAKPGGARLLYNWRPTTSGIQMRGGSRLHATLDAAAVGAVMVYDSGSTRKLFAATPTFIYEVLAPADPEVAPSADISGQTSGAWSSALMTTTGGTFLVCVNGADSMQQYNGTTWTTITGVSSPAITGVTTSVLSHVWTYRNRLFFVDAGTMDAWYLPVDAIAGAVRRAMGGERKAA